jgi:hypothetical protein
MQPTRNLILHGAIIFATLRQYSLNVIYYVLHAVILTYSVIICSKTVVTRLKIFHV